jgi:hypothetical protein
MRTNQVGSSDCQSERALRLPTSDGGFLVRSRSGGVAANYESNPLILRAVGEVLMILLLALRF